MKYLRNAWYVAAWAEQLLAGELLARTYLNEPVVLFRDGAGMAHALADRCPHRFAPLSRGAIVGGERLRCAYHGLEFSGKAPNSGVRAFPLVERHSILWIWMGDPARADAEAIPAFPMLDPDAEVQISARDGIRMAAHYELITDNLLDLSHVSFLHEGILGNEETIPAEIEVKREGDRLRVGRLMTNVPVPGMFDLLYKQDGGRVDLWNVMTWDAPGCMVNNAGVTEPGAPREAGTGIFGHHFLTPESDRTTFYHFAAVRQNPLPAPEGRAEELRDRLTELRRIAFAEQDAPMIEAQQIRRDAAEAEGVAPVLLSIDKGPAAYRRILQEMIDADG
jgi:vanillate O-demethylase monooxygenase subunit